MFARTALRLLALVLLFNAALSADPLLQPLPFDEGATGLALARHGLASWVDAAHVRANGTAQSLWIA